MKYYCLGCAILFFLLPNPADAGTALSGKMEKMMKDIYPANEPGVAVIVTRNGETIFRGASGMANLEHQIPLEPDMVFRLGSITKQVTAAAIMMLVEQGKCSLDDPITRFLPDYPMGDKPITVRHLLDHTSGIASYTSIPGYMTSNDIKRDLTTDELVGVFKDRSKNFEPGEQFRYNNSGYVLLGAIIEKISGKSYAQFVEQEIFTKLGMSHSFYDDSKRLIPKRVSGYHRDGDQYVNCDILSMTQPHAAGSLASSVDDMAIWTQSLFNGKLINTISLDAMTTSTRLNNGNETGYGFGFFIDEIRGMKAIRHDGGIHGFFTSGFYLPESKVYVLVLCNSPMADVGPDQLGLKLAALAAGNPFPEWEAVELPRETLKSYVGTYKISDNENREILFRDGSLYSRRRGVSQEIKASSETAFFFVDSLAHLEFVVKDGKVEGVNIYQANLLEPEWCPFLKPEVSAPVKIEVSEDILAKYPGSYELAPTFSIDITLEDGALFAQATGQPKFPIYPEQENLFFLEVVEAKIEFNAEGLILHQNGRSLVGKRK